MTKTEWTVSFEAWLRDTGRATLEGEVQMIAANMAHIAYREFSQLRPSEVNKPRLYERALHACTF